ncbi:MAG: hypothetical protein WB489_24580 [Pseudolabrys sp.]
MPTAKPTSGKLLPPLPPAMPDWSPVRTFGGYRRPRLLVLGGVT